jgi:hypothetical protein
MRTNIRFFDIIAKKPVIWLTDFTSTVGDYVFLKTLCFIFEASQKPTVSEKASTTISGKVFVYPLKAEAAISPTVRARPISRLYVTRVNSNTSKPGKISADKYLITISKMVHLIYSFLFINFRNLFTKLQEKRQEIYNSCLRSNYPLFLRDINKAINPATNAAIER